MACDSYIGKLAMTVIAELEKVCYAKEQNEVDSKIDEICNNINAIEYEEASKKIDVLLAELQAKSQEKA